MRLIGPAALMLPLLIGCGAPPPTMAGGRPVTHWVLTLKESPDPKLRRAAAFKLGNVGAADPSAFSAVVAALKDSDGSVRSEAIVALMKFGPAAAEAVPVLAELRDGDPEAKVRDFAAKALQKLRR